MLDEVSVVLCTYNGERYLPALLKSFDEQTHAISEVVLYDDGSTDGTIDLLRAYAAERRQAGTRVHLLANEGRARGASQAFSHAAAFATGTYVALADQDDVWSKRRLSEGIAALTSGEHSLAGSDAEVVDEAGGESGATVFGHFESKLMPRTVMVSDPLRCLVRQNFLPGMTMTMERGSLQSWLPVPQGWMHDYWFALNAAAAGRLAVIPSPLVKYRQHDSNVLGVKRQLSIRRLIAATLRRGRSGSAPTADWLTAPDEWSVATLLGRKIFFERDRAALRGSRRWKRLAFGLRRIRDYGEFSHLGALGIVRDVVLNS